MTVLDTSAVVDFLLGIGVARQVEELMATEGELAAPDLLVFETLAVLRRQTHRHAISKNRAAAAVEDLGDLPVELFPRPSPAASRMGATSEPHGGGRTVRGTGRARG